MNHRPYIVRRYEAAILQPGLHPTRPIEANRAARACPDLDPLADLRVQLARVPRSVDQRNNVFVDGRRHRHPSDGLTHRKNHVLRKRADRRGRVVAFASEKTQHFALALWRRISNQHL